MLCLNERCLPKDNQIIEEEKNVVKNNKRILNKYVISSVVLNVGYSDRWRGKRC